MLRDFAEGFDGAAQSFAVARGLRGERRAFGTLLAEREIAAEHEHSRLREGFGDGFEQSRIAVAAGAVGDDQAVAVGVLGFVKEAPDHFGLKMFQP